jgi:hypothetical protein
MSLSRARVVVVADQASGRAIVPSLVRMGLAGVRTVDGFAEARTICEAGEADACLVVLPPAIPDETPCLTADTQAPGHGTRAPSLLLADVITPSLTKAARRAGYAAVAVVGMAPRMLYRRISGLLQDARRSAAGDPGRRAAPKARRLRSPPAEGAPGRVMAAKLKLQ